MTRVNGAWLTDPAAQQVCRVLTDAEYQAWFVGGCVRNALLGVSVADLDLTTDARPDVVTQLATAAGLKVIPTGIDHGTVTVVAQNTPFEVTTFRRDVATDGRRAVVAFADTMVEDARRRDFTMNALYAGPDGVVVDPLGGLPDLFARHVRFIEDADQRIREDYLRILRFFRFHAWYGADGLDPEALAACAANIDGLASLSRERVTAEMFKLLSAPDPAPAVASMAAAGVLAQILPGADAAPLAVLVHIEGVAGLPPSAIRRLGALGGDPAGALKLSKRDALALEHMRSDLPLPELAYRHGAEAAINKAAITAAVLGQELDTNIVKNAQFAASRTFPLQAADLMPDLNGPALGQAMKKAEAVWIASDFTMTKADLLLELRG
ncbi:MULTISPECIES: CCA tRNA nucleotidyltransferase [unclassified Yoonia]|uniref:CCA tRNA nucleotidyltransferase n=1 Tax=unclassified Yoonia TaxID=2629118 RepID=UPI002AFFECF2|nr:MULTISPECIES: CCA tRNA nucleotidyltransferase [unclassified Yoonia]